MLLTKIEQKKLQSYVIKHMKKNYQLLEESFIDYSTDELTNPIGHSFVKNLIEQDYKQAFSLICTNYNADNKLTFMSQLIGYIFPNVNSNWMKYEILNESFTKRFKQYMKYECKCVEELPNILF